MNSLAAAPRVSVVVPLYNKRAYVERSVRSALAQGAAVHEVIVVDDGSTDGGADAIEAWNDARVRVLRQANSGVSAARNAGIDAASGDWVAFLDADDVWLPGYVDELLTLMQGFPGAVACATSYVRVWPEGRRKPAFLPRGVDGNRPQLLGDPFGAWARAAFLFTSSLCVNRAFLVDRGIRFPRGENQGEDQDVIFQLMAGGEIAFSPRPLVEYTQAVGGSLSSDLPDRVLPCYLRLLQRTRESNFPQRHKRGALRVVAVNFLNVARTLMAKGRRREAIALVYRREATRHSSYWLRTAAALLWPAGHWK